jgi:hypothetical protein
LLKVEIDFVREWRDGKPALILESMHHREDEDSELNLGNKTEFIKGHGEIMLCRMQDVNVHGTLYNMQEKTKRL